MNRKKEEKLRNKWFKKRWKRISADPQLMKAYILGNLATDADDIDIDSIVAFLEDK